MNTIIKNKANDVYTANGTMNVAAGATVGDTMDIIQQHKRFSLKNWFFDYQLIVAGVHVPISQIINQQIRCGFTYPYANLPAKAFLNVVPGAGSAVTVGTPVNLFNPNQINFEGFYFQGTMGFEIELINFDLVNAAGLRYSLIVEIEIIG